MKKIYEAPDCACVAIKHEGFIATSTDSEPRIFSGDEEETSQGFSDTFEYNL